MCTTHHVTHVCKRSTVRKYSVLLCHTIRCSGRQQPTLHVQFVARIVNKTRRHFKVSHQFEAVHLLGEHSACTALSVHEIIIQFEYAIINSLID